jgi:hypothetical protein
VVELVGEALGVLDHRQRAVRMAEQPGVHRALIPAADAGVVTAVEERRRGVPSRIVERDALLDVAHRLGGPAPGGERGPQGVMGLDRSGGVAPASGGFEEAPTRLLRLGVAPPAVVHEP